MSNLSKLEFVALDISGKNLLWVLDVEIHLAAKGLDATITQKNEASSQDKTKAMIFLRHHLDEGQKIEYLMQQYCEKDFQKYFELISCHLMDEQHKTLSMKNHEARPTGTASLPETNVVEARDQSEVKRVDHRANNNAQGRGKDKRKENKNGVPLPNAQAESHMTLKDDDKPRTSNKYDKDVEANLALKDDVFYGFGDITHTQVDDFFGDRN
ncbi:uncharacterized protein LOC107001503 [Solanum pennellii]|uniref:Uncharacterized protein LOC107001503 n=1 Tax=Solanum pennellii TaxID=28526 RepID=A0ABM1FCP2_SOLPN|nr:uncharacterized protein LOC107001503 [Solanum pennellii]